MVCALQFTDNKKYLWLKKKKKRKGVIFGKRKTSVQDWDSTTYVEIGALHLSALTELCNLGNADNLIEHPRECIPTY